MAYECSPCGTKFGSLDAFDRHRVGRHEYTSTQGLAMEPPREDGRRCLYRHEFEEAGLVQNVHGTWTLARTLKAARAAFQTQLSGFQGHLSGEAAG